MNKKGSIALVILGIIAVIALVGMILLFTGKITGNAAIPPCTDSDGGLNYPVRGIVTVVGDYGVPVKFIDQCERAMSGVAKVYGLSENYCAGSKRNFAYYTCPRGCLNGACI
jgi:hypothetical protein